MTAIVGFGVLVGFIVAAVLVIGSLIWLWEKDILQLIIFVVCAVAVVGVIGTMLFRVCHYLGMMVLT